MKKIIAGMALAFLFVGSASAMEMATKCDSCGWPGLGANVNTSATASPTANAGSSSQSSGGFSMAQSAGGSATGGSANSTSGSNTGANNQNITFNSTTPADTTATIHQSIDGTQTVRNTPSVSGPPLVSSNDTLTL